MHIIKQNKHSGKKHVARCSCGKTFTGYSYIQKVLNHIGN